MEKIDQFIEDIENEDVAFEETSKQRTLVPLKTSQVRRRNDGYYIIKVSSGGRKAIVPQDTLERLVRAGISLRVLKDRCNTLSALGNDFDKPLMYYAIVAYNLVPKEEWSKWTNSNPLLKYELIHLNGDIDDIRKENVRITYRNNDLWSEIKEKHKSQNKTGADKEYTKCREDFFREKYTEFPDLKVMTRVTDIVKKVKGGSSNNIEGNCEEMLETISK